MPLGSVSTTPVPRSDCGIRNDSVECMDPKINLDVRSPGFSAKTLPESISYGAWGKHFVLFFLRLKGLQFERRILITLSIAFL